MKSFWNQKVALTMAALALMLTPSHSFVTTANSASSIKFPLETSNQLLQAVDAYVNNDDQDVLLAIITTHGAMENWDVSQITDFSNLFNQERNPNVVQFYADLSKWDVSSAITFTKMFKGARFVDFNVSSWDVSNAKNFSHMFDSASSFQGRGLSSWNVTNGQDFTEMFRGAIAFGTNPSTNNLCAWSELIATTAITNDMFFQSQCPIELDFDYSNVVAQSLRNSAEKPTIITSFCQPCPKQSIIEESTPESGSDGPPLSSDEVKEETELNDDGKRPNILFLMTDQQRFDTIRKVQDELSHYDSAFKIDTPNLDRLLSEGAYFRNAYSQCAVCAPARTTIRTGCTIERTGVQHNDLAEDYQDGKLFQERVEALESLDHILVERYGYISEYYGKWHMPDKLFESKTTGERLIRFNDYDFRDDEFSFIGDDSSKKIRRYLEQYEDNGKITREQKQVDGTSLVYAIMPNMTNAHPQIDSYTRYPYIPIQLDTRYGRPIGTDLKDGTFDSDQRSQSSLMGFYSLSEDATPSHFTGDIAIRALKRLKEQSQPWFLTISFHHPHPPFIAPYGSYLSKYWAHKDDLHVAESLHDPMDNSAYTIITDKYPGYKDPEKIQEWTAIYYALIEEIDDEVGELLSLLGDDEEDTLIIFTSDHGEMLGAHAKRSKNTFYEEAVKVPLLMKFPGRIEGGTEVNEAVSHLDLFATILDYAGASKADNSDGTSFRSFVEGTEFNQDYDEGDVVFAEWDFRKPVSRESNMLDRDIDDRPSFMVRKGHYKLMMQKLASSREMDMMFDLRSDPFEMNNLLGKNAMTANEEVIHKAEHMRCLLLDWMGRLDGDKGYFSDPAANYGDSAGDIVEIRNRQKWKEVGVWISDQELEFGRLTMRNDGSFVRHEHLYVGTRANETIILSSFEFTGASAEMFSVSPDPIVFKEKDCVRIRITLESEKAFPQGSFVDAKLRFKVNRSEGMSSNLNFIASQGEVRLSLNKDVYGEPSDKLQTFDDEPDVELPVETSSSVPNPEETSSPISNPDETTGNSFVPNPDFSSPPHDPPEALRPEPGSSVEAADGASFSSRGWSVLFCAGWTLLHAMYQQII